MFQSKQPKGETQGKSENFSSKAIFEAGGGTVECEGEKSGVGVSEAHYKVQKEDTEQGQIKSGGHLNINVIKWGRCTAKVGEVKEAPATVSSCEQQIKQKAAKEPGKGVGFGGIITECIVKTVVVGAKCEIKVGPESNQSLSSVNYENSGGNLLITPEVSGITDTVSVGCGTAGIKATKEGKFKAKLTAPEVQTE
jgi:ribosomal protein L7/L12